MSYAISCSCKLFLLEMRRILRIKITYNFKFANNLANDRKVAAYANNIFSEICLLIDCLKH